MGYETWLSSVTHELMSDIGGSYNQCRFVLSDFSTTLGALYNEGESASSAAAALTERIWLAA
jgi:hypothetical protein